MASPSLLTAGPPGSLRISALSPASSEPGNARLVHPGRGTQQKPQARARADSGAFSRQPGAAAKRQEVVTGAASGFSWGPLAPLVDLFASKRGGGKDAEEEREAVKAALLEAIAPLARGVNATEYDREEVEELASKLESLNPTPGTISSPLLSGKWKLLYTTSNSIIGTNRLPFLRPFGPIYQCIDADTLQARNIESWPFFNQVQATLTPVTKTKVNVKFDYFKILGLIPVKAPEPRGNQAFLDTTYLDDDLRISRGNLGNLFILTMEDPSYRIELPGEAQEEIYE